MFFISGILLSISPLLKYKNCPLFLKVLVHGEKTEMQKLKNELLLQYGDNADYNVQVYMPRNTQPVELYFRGEKTAKIVGKLASLVKPEENAVISGVLVKKNFKYQIMLPEDLPKYTDLAVTEVLQRQSVPFTGNPRTLLSELNVVCGSLDAIKSSKNYDVVGVKIYNEIAMYFDTGYVILEVIFCVLIIRYNTATNKKNNII